MHRANAAAPRRSPPPAEPPGWLSWTKLTDATLKMRDLSGSSNAERSPDCRPPERSAPQSGELGTASGPAPAFKVAALLRRGAGSPQLS